MSTRYGYLCVTDGAVSPASLANMLRDEYGQVIELEVALREAT